jgi:hypothetical protein
VENEGPAATAVDGNRSVCIVVRREERLRESSELSCAVNL